MNPTSKKKPDIVIVDDHLLFRQGLKSILNYENIGSVIGEASNGEEFIKLLQTLTPDLVLMDIDMPLMNGLEATQKALKLLPDLKIIAFTEFSEEEYCSEMRDLGAKGFLKKSDGFNELENAIQIVMKGENYFISELSSNIENENKHQELIQLVEEDTKKTKGKMMFFP